VQVFSYLGDVFADGEQARISPQAYFYRGRFGLLGEYIVSKQDVAAPARGVEDTLMQQKKNTDAAIEDMTSDGNAPDADE